MTPQRVFIDAMNVIRTNLSLAKFEERQGPVAASRRLLQLVDANSRRARERAEWIVVFDGPNNLDPRTAQALSVQTLFSEERSADEIIVEKATDAVALGYQTIIVSNDRDVRVDGAIARQSEDFFADLVRGSSRLPTADAVREYEDLMLHRAEEPTTGKVEFGHRLLTKLIELGHLPASAANSDQLGNGLTREIRSGLANKLPLQKISKRIELFLRQHVRVQPDPDPQKEIQRAIKTALTQGLP